MKKQQKLGPAIGPTQRQQKVAEQVRHILTGILQRQEIWCSHLQKTVVIVSEVKVSIDMAHAFVFIMPLGGEEIEQTLSALKESATAMRRLVAQRLHLKATPQLHFFCDTTFDNIERIEKLLRNPKILQDLKKD